MAESWSSKLSGKRESLISRPPKLEYLISKSPKDDKLIAWIISSFDMKLKDRAMRERHLRSH